MTCIRCSADAVKTYWKRHYCLTCGMTWRDGCESVDEEIDSRVESRYFGIDRSLICIEREGKRSKGGPIDS